MNITGLKDGSKQEQILLFYNELKSVFPEFEIPKHKKKWISVFMDFFNIIKQHGTDKKIVLFLDELPWLAGKRSGLLQALDYVWNTKLSNLSGLKLIACGSAASWILNNLINAKGRVT